MKLSKANNLDPHQTGLFFGSFLAIGSAVFSVIAIGTMLAGNADFEVMEYGLGIESRYVRALLAPPIAFLSGYTFSYLLSKIIRWASSRFAKQE